MPQIVSFWGCWKLGGKTPRFIHKTKEAAVAEACRLSTETNTPVHVVECIGCAVGDLYFPVDQNEKVG